MISNSHELNSACGGSGKGNINNLSNITMGSDLLPVPLLSYRCFLTKKRMRNIKLIGLMLRYEPKNVNHCINKHLIQHLKAGVIELM